MQMTQAEYDRAMDSFRIESKKFRAAEAAYRARKINDSEYLLARSEFKAASAIADYAEKQLIEAK